VEFKKPKSLKRIFKMKRSSLKLFLILTLTTCFSIYTVFRCKNVNKLEWYEGLELNISKGYIDTIKNGLEQYHSIHSHYPITDGKYYLDSILSFITVDKAYLRQDSLGASNEVVSVKDGIIKNEIKGNHFYIGVGIKENLIYYACQDGLHYILYYKPDTLSRHFIPPAETIYQN
jgi:hypothetical protein